MSTTPHQHGFDEAALNEWLTAHVEGFDTLQELVKFGDGQSNPTYRVDAASGSYVLRAKPPGELLKSAHAVDREYRVMKALSDTPVAVPKMLVLVDEDDSPIGRMFFVMEHCDGRILWDPSLPESDKADRAGIYEAQNATLAALHDVDPAAVGLSDFGKPGDYFARQTTRWAQQYEASEVEYNATMHELIAWLTANLPEDDGQVSIVHGDYRIDNMIFRNDAPEVMAVLDWELSTLGHPLADLAYQCMQWRLPNQGAMRGLAGIDRTALGIPTEDEYVARYCERRGVTKPDSWPFYIAFCFFRLAAILQGVYKRALDGNASNPERGIKMAAAIPLLAGAAMQEVKKA
ncbi:phosphotransferase family protein [Ahrensia sp. R2A130]|uniref:phosphotransferase family protein n=1 Tax=Ahrensia sp. R2A130 TaxID=744979 RepID=UPI0001E0F0F4|nr:phosphotransferase family protein [Ahrensia sp. R2A130]EFL89022.1 acyl-CoA dehydrogenase family member 10 [Ahrensia sp. R2A130]